jgi:hypothetical protein
MKVSLVKIGNLELEGIQLENGDFAVAVNEIARFYSLDDETIRKHIKIGVDIVSLSMFLDLTKYLADEGNRTAQLLLLTLFQHGLNIFNSI